VFSTNSRDATDPDCGWPVPSGKSTHEFINGWKGRRAASTRVQPSFAGVLIQILLLDVVFSLDSVITAIGMVDQVAIMVAAVILAVLFMMLFSSPISAFVERHPTVKCWP